MTSNTKKIAIGADHAGFEYKNAIINKLKAEGFEVIDMGTHSLDSVDYPDFVHPLAEAVTAKEYDFGILICGSGNGVCMTANKHQGVRSAICWNKEIAQLAREHNNANIITLPARFISEEEALKIVETFFSAKFEGGRHERRVNKISCA